MTENERLELTWSQLYWLDTHGGRTVDDVKADDDGLYVLFGGRIIKKVYLPLWKTKEITLE
jgi:hypothetical protein